VRLSCNTVPPPVWVNHQLAERERSTSIFRYEFLIDWRGEKFPPSCISLRGVTICLSDFLAIN